MRAWGSLVCLACASVVALALPAVAAARPSDDQGRRLALSFFELKGTNGYTIEAGELRKGDPATLDGGWRTLAPQNRLLRHLRYLWLKRFVNSFLRRAYVGRPNITTAHQSRAGDYLYSVLWVWGGAGQVCLVGWGWRRFKRQDPKTPDPGPVRPA